MSFGKLYTFKGNARTNGLLAVAHENNLKLEIVETKPSDGVTDDYRKLNKLGKIPTFVGSDGFILSECIAIAVYLASQNEKTTLLGKTKQDYASILRWMSFSNSDYLSNFGGWYGPLIGRAVYNKKSVETSITKTKDVLKTFEDHLLINTYLVGERVTLADLMCSGIIARGFELFFDGEFQKDFPNLTRWFQTITNQPGWMAANGEAKLCDKAMENKAPASAQQSKKEKDVKKEQPKAAAAVAAQDEDDEEPKSEPKPKHPIEALGRATFSIDDWKRKYKNTNDTRGDAMPWFWQNVKFDEYSIWQFDFKYNEELTMTFMSANQVGGFFNRLEGSRKYLMGCGSVYGKANDSVIRGAFLVRGQDANQAFDVAPDWESYEFKKLDPTSPADQSAVTDLWAWDKPITINGKEYEWADGKIFV